MPSTHTSGLGCLLSPSQRGDALRSHLVVVRARWMVNRHVVRGLTRRGAKRNDVDFVARVGAFKGSDGARDYACGNGEVVQIVNDANFLASRDRLGARLCGGVERAGAG